MSFNENLRTPAILYQPRLFPPRVISAPTSHVDIVPTLLDALGTPYDPALLQGESLLQNEFRRRYIFAYGNEDTVTSVSAAELKLQISLRDGSCWAFDLKSDPEERRRLGCQHYPEQQQALLAYRRNQQSALRRYNQFSRRSAVSYGAFATRQPGHSP
jgi:arylsulfatase A-like enzyme